MVKKITTFISPPVRRKMETDRQFFESPGLLAALLIVSEVLVRTICQPFTFDSCEDAVSQGCCFPRLWKYLSVGCAENEWLRRAFEKAMRAEATITFSGNMSLDVMVRFYKRGEREELCSWNPMFRISDGAVTACASSGLP